MFVFLYLLCRFICHFCRSFLFRLRGLTTLTYVCKTSGQIECRESAFCSAKGRTNAFSQIFSYFFRRRIHLRASRIRFILVSMNLVINNVVLTNGTIKIISVKRRACLSIRTFFRRRIGATCTNLSSNSIAIVRCHSIVNGTVGRSCLIKNRYHAQEDRRIFGSALIRKGSVNVTFGRRTTILTCGNLLNGVGTVRFPTFIVCLQFQEVSVLRLRILNNDTRCASTGDCCFSQWNVCKRGSAPPRAITG